MIRVTAAFLEQKVGLRQTAEQCRRADVATDLSGGDGEADRMPLTVADGMQPCVHVGFGAADQASMPPF